MSRDSAQVQKLLCPVHSNLCPLLLKPCIYYSFLYYLDTLLFKITAQKDLKALISVLRGKKPQQTNNPLLLLFSKLWIFCCQSYTDERHSFVCLLHECIPLLSLKIMSNKTKHVQNVFVFVVLKSI